jgi:hypothetical protein
VGAGGAKYENVILLEPSQMHFCIFKYIFYLLVYFIFHLASFFFQISFFFLPPFSYFSSFSIHTLPRQDHATLPKWLKITAHQENEFYSFKGKKLNLRKEMSNQFVLIFCNANPCIFHKRSGIDLAGVSPGALAQDGIL